MEFSIKTILSQTLGIFFTNKIRLTVSLTVFCLALLLLAFLTLYAIGYTKETAPQYHFVLQNIETLHELEPHMQSMALKALVGALVYSVGVIIFFAMLFNTAVRLGALGPAGTYPGLAQMVKTGVINAVKLVFITLYVLPGLFLLGFLLAMTGLIPADSVLIPDQQATSFSEGYIQGLEHQLKLSTMIQNFIFTYFTCLMYSFMSANLTKTALQDGISSYDTPHTASFAIVLLVLYVASQIPVYILLFMGYYISASVVNGVSYLIVLLLVGLSHGIRHRMCAHSGEGAAQVTETQKATPGNEAVEGAAAVYAGERTQQDSPDFDQHSEIKST